MITKRERCVVHALWFIAMVAFVTGIAPCRAGTLMWTNTAGGDWNASPNWSPNQVPASGDTVVITNAGTYTVTNTSSTTLAI
jgi:hypothetical protein